MVLQRDARDDAIKLSPTGLIGRAGWWSCCRRAIDRRLRRLTDRKLSVALIGFASFLICLLWLGNVWRISEKHEQIERDVAEVLQSTSVAISQRLYSDFLVADVLLGTLRAEIERHPDRDPLNEPSLGGLINVFRTRTSSVTDLRIIDKQGFMLSLDEPGQSKQTWVGDREYARVPLETGQDTPFFGVPVLSRIDQTSRRWVESLRLHGDQPWMGLLAVGFTDDRIIAPLAAARPKPNGTMTLYRLDGTLMAAVPDAGPRLGQHSEANKQQIDSLLARGPSGMTRLARWDGADEEIYVAYNQLDNYPLVLVTTLKVRDVHAILVIEIWQSCLVLALLSVITLGGAGWLARLMRQLRKANAGLEDQVAARTRDLTAEIEHRRITEVRLQKFMRAVESSDCGVVISDRTLTVEYTNPAFARMLGYECDKLVGKSRDLWSSPNRTRETDQELQSVIMDKHTWRGELLHQRRDGTDFWVLATVSPILSSTGEITHFVAVEEDITERRRYETDLRQAKAIAERANQAKSEFLSSMSHELRTPMNAILGFAQLLHDSHQEPLTNRQRMFVDRILRGGAHLLELINEVLDLARIEAGQLRLSLEPVDLGSVLSDCLTLVEVLAEKYNVTVIDQTAGHPLATLHGDYTRLKQAVLNLLSNAVKYNRPGGTVTLSLAATTGDRVRLMITDSGRGIPAERQRELFQPFNRLGQESSTIEGTGIGLTVTRRVIEAMKGTLGFTSEDGVGSCFWIELPTADPAHLDDRFKDATALAYGPAPPSHAEERWRSLLYIEDNPANLSLMNSIVEEKTSFNFLSAHTAELGIAIIRSKQPAVVVIDINLPDMNGIALARYLSQLPETSQIPLIALSADAMPATIESSLAAGFRKYLVKPIDINAFLAALDELAPPSVAPPGNSAI